MATDDDSKTEPNCAAEGRAITRALRSMLAKARVAGCENPTIFIEAESHAVFVMDGDHPHERNSNEADAAERQEAIVCRADIGTLGVSFDTGAW